MDFYLKHSFWMADARLPSWAGFQTRNGPYGSVSSDAPSDGSVRIVFAREDRDKSPLSADELALVQWLLDHDHEVAPALLRALLAEYPKLQARYQGTERDRSMPVVSRANEFKRLIGLHTVHVHQTSRNGLPYLGYEFGCSWDEEHGLGVLMHGSRAVQIGGADTAFMPWIAKRDAGSDK